jgi:acylphosphatase
MVAGEFSPAIRRDVQHCLGMGAVNRVRARVFYSGRVQGVGFRYTTKTTATGFELSGAIRNLPDGRVELVAEGMKAELEAFLVAIRESGLGHFIESETIDWGEAKNEFRGFEIVK